MANTSRPYHHGDLERAVIDGAVDEVQKEGIAGVSMRRIARRAGVSHAAIAYRFGDKTGVFTAVATEGFRLQADMLRSSANGVDDFLRGGQAYITFALAHPGYFEVMFRPYLYRGDDPSLLDAKGAAFEVLSGTARASLGEHAGEEEVSALALAGWCMSHGFATLALTSNILELRNADPIAVAEKIRTGTVALGKLAAKL
ncbi:TetR/AcrR family transcriptional regulator [Mycolicibacterium neoaurum]|uniref:TetR/AcrR family transcriptional regulator n=1 Tax=Mycolicibacterium neoaurum TaxID=1795 RepID=UPI00267104E4|nr:TetR/AcrR family transcriptional regulator [Mycolicibacterium neoaurum]MDO3400207.1 TetR/AcrR family transcriptional regulator [Mycolicibacterium neoaurum]